MYYIPTTFVVTKWHAWYTMAYHNKKQGKSSQADKEIKYVETSREGNKIYCISSFLTYSWYFSEVSHTSIVVTFYIDKQHVCCNNQGLRFQSNCT
jgi:hypothetical protein